MVNVELTKHQGQLIIDCDVHTADEMNSKSPKNHPVGKTKHIPCLPSEMPNSSSSNNINNNKGTHQIIRVNRNRVIISLDQRNPKPQLNNRKCD